MSKKVIIGQNDLSTLYPKLVKEWQVLYQVFTEEKHEPQADSDGAI